MINTFGENTMRIRSEKNISRRKLAAISGVTEQALVNIEFGRTAPLKTTKIKIAKALNCEVDELERTIERNYSFATVLDVATCLLSIRNAAGKSRCAFEWDEDKSKLTFEINQKDLCQALVSKLEIEEFQHNRELGRWAYDALCEGWAENYAHLPILEN